MKTWKYSLMIIVVLLLIAGCNTPKTGQNSAVQKNASKDNTINYGNHKRPNSEYITLRVGDYTVGKDIKPGRYYLYKEKINSDNSAEFVIYDETEHYDDMIYPKFKVPSVELIEGRKISVWTDSITLSTEYVPVEDFYEIKDPGGTTVPKGMYHIGTDIPAGSYELYPITFDGASGMYFADEETYELLKIDGSNEKEMALKFMPLEINFDSANYGQNYYFPEGSVLVLGDTIKMKKVEALKFD